MNLSRRALIIVLTAYWTALCIGTHLPPRGLPSVSVSDKVLHFGAYLVLAAMLVQVVPRRSVLITLIVCALYGAIDEWTQTFVGRDCELLDWLADVIGALLGAAIARRWPIPFAPAETQR